MLNYGINFAAFMSTESNVTCVVCGSKDAFVVFDFSLNGKKMGHCGTCGASWAAT